MEENKVKKRIYFWVTGERFDKENISRIYNEMKYNFYLPSDLANGLSESDYGAVTNIDLEKAKEFARKKVKDLKLSNSFCYLVEKEYSFTEEQWKALTDSEGNINLSKLGMNEFPEFEEPSYSISKIKNNENLEENTIHIEPQEEIDSAVLNLVTSEYNKGFRLLNNLYDFSEKSDLFSNCKDLEKLNKSIQQKNQNNLTNIQKLDKLGKSLESMIPLKILCYMISDAKLLLGNKKEYSTDEIERNKKENEKKKEEFKSEKDRMIKEIKDYSRKVGINIENIFSQDGTLLDRKFTIDNPEFTKELMNLEVQKQNKVNETSEEVGD